MEVGESLANPFFLLFERKKEKKVFSDGHEKKVIKDELEKKERKVRRKTPTSHKQCRLWLFINYRKAWNNFLQFELTQK